jgi:hypothetical protein
MFWQMSIKHTDAKFRTVHACQELAKLHGSFLDTLTHSVGLFLFILTPDDNGLFLHTMSVNEMSVLSQYAMAQPKQGIIACN